MKYRLGFFVIIPLIIGLVFINGGCSTSVTPPPEISPTPTPTPPQSPETTVPDQSGSCPGNYQTKVVSISYGENPGNPDLAIHITFDEAISLIDDNPENWQVTISREVPYKTFAGVKDSYKVNLDADVFDVEQLGTSTVRIKARVSEYPFGMDECFEVSYTGAIDTELTGTFEGTFSGDYEGDFYYKGMFYGVDYDIHGEFWANFLGVNVVGDWEGVIEGEPLDGTYAGWTLGELEGWFEAWNWAFETWALYRGEIHGEAEDVQAHGEFCGDLDGTFKWARFEGSLDAEIYGIYVGFVRGTFVGYVNGVYGDYSYPDRTWVGPVLVEGSFDGEIEGILDSGLWGMPPFAGQAEWIDPTIDGEFCGDLHLGHFDGDIYGELAGYLYGYFEGLLTGWFEGEMEGELDGTLKGVIEGTFLIEDNFCPVKFHGLICDEDSYSKYFESFYPEEELNDFWIKYNPPIQSRYEQFYADHVKWEYKGMVAIADIYGNICPLCYPSGQACCGVLCPTPFIPVCPVE